MTAFRTGPDAPFIQRATVPGRDVRILAVGRAGRYGIERVRARFGDLEEWGRRQAGVRAVAEAGHRVIRQQHGEAP